MLGNFADPWRVGLGSIDIRGCLPPYVYVGYGVNFGWGGPIKGYTTHLVQGLYGPN